MIVAVLFGIGIGIGLGLGCQRGQTGQPSGGAASAVENRVPAESTATAPGATTVPAPNLRPVATTAPTAPAAAPTGPVAAIVPAVANVAAEPPAVANVAAEPPAVANVAAEPPAVTVEPSRVTLPKSPSTPPRRTKRPLTRKELRRLSAFAFEDFEREDRGTTARFTEFRHTTVARPKLGVTVTIEPCGRAKAGKRASTRPAVPTKRLASGKVVVKPPAPPPCTPMELDQWKAKGTELKQFLSKALVERPETLFEVGARDLSGATAIYTYQLGYFFGKDDKDQPIGDYSDAYILYYNDGVNQIRVNAHYRDDALGGKDQLLAVAPPEDLEKLAVAFMSFYVHQWK